MSNTIKVGSAIKSFRKHKKLSLQEFANKLNKALPTVKKYESDDILVPLDILDDICNILEVTLDQLWFLSRLNDEQILRNNVVRILKKLNLSASFTNNNFIVISSTLSEETISIAQDYSILKQYINDIYCDYQPISNLIPDKIIFLAIAKYWQNDIMLQIKKALDETSQMLIYEQKTAELHETASKEAYGLELLKNIFINSNNANHEIIKIIPLLEELNIGLAKIV